MIHWIRKPEPLVYAFIVLLISGCSFFSNYTVVTVEFPSVCSPWEEYGGIRGYLLVFPDPLDNEKLEKKVINSSTKKIQIKIRKGTAIPVALYPNNILKPVGGIFPVDLINTTTLVLSAEKGFLADLLLGLLPEGERIESINIPRLQKILMENSGGDPWCIDAAVLKTALILGSLSVYKIKKEQTLGISISDAAGNWISDDPFRVHVSSEEYTGELFIELPSGVTSFYNPDTKEELCVSVAGSEYEYIRTK